MEPKTNPEVVTKMRQVAIDHHHEVVDRFASNYEAMRLNRFSNAFTYGRFKVDMLLDAMLHSLPASADVLDLGCGTGEYLGRIASMGLTAHGLEPAPSMLATAREQNPDTDIKEGVATELPFADQSMDAIFAIEVFRYLHLSDTEQALNECFRVLKPGGKLFITMVNRWALDGFFLLQRLRRLTLAEEFNNKHPHCEFFTPGEVTNLLSRANFTDIDTKGNLFGPIRMLYKLHTKTAATLSQVLEPLDDQIHQWDLLKPFAGHLIATAQRPNSER